MNDRAVAQASTQTLAESLAAHVATSTPSADVWHRVAHGELTPDEAEKLLLASTEPGAAERDAIERAKQVLAPPSPEQHQAGLEALLARCAAEDAEGGAVVVPLRRWRARRWLVGTLAAAAAVVLSVWLVRPRAVHEPEAFVGSYEIEIDNGAAMVRGAEPEAGLPTFLLDDELRIRLVPEAAMEGPIGVVVFATDRSGRAHRVEVETRVHERGVVELVTTVKALDLAEGEWELVIAVGWADALPDSWDELAGRAGPGYEVARRRLRVVARL